MSKDFNATLGMLRNLLPENYGQTLDIAITAYDKYPKTEQGIMQALQDFNADIEDLEQMFKMFQSRPVQFAAKRISPEFTKYLNDNGSKIFSGIKNYKGGTPKSSTSTPQGRGLQNKNISQSNKNALDRLARLK